MITAGIITKDPNAVGFAGISATASMYHRRKDLPVNATPVIALELA
jgi:hypothetical protein